MLIENWMQRKVITVKPLDSLRHARLVMEQHRINQLPVVAGGHLVGIVTDRDLRDAFPSVLDHRRHRAVADADPETVPVETVMTRNLLTLAPKDSLESAADVMRRERIGAVPIVEGRKLVGILTRSDLLDAFVGLSEIARQPFRDASPPRGVAGR